MCTLFLIHLLQNVIKIRYFNFFDFYKSREKVVLLFHPPYSIFIIRMSRENIYIYLLHSSFHELSLGTEIYVQTRPLKLVLSYMDLSMQIRF